MSKTPKGVVVTLAGPDGYVVAKAVDFDSGSYSGFSLLEAQRIRARGAMAHDLIQNGCSPWIVKAVSTYEAERIRDTLISTHGFKETVIEIGHDDEEMP